MSRWKNPCESEKIEMFVIVGEYFQENDYEFEEIKPQILTYLTNLESNFTSRFSIPSLLQHEWNGSPILFTASEKISPLL
jgi:hypothetical protein